MSSFLDGPSIISIFLRLGWTIGNVQQRYISSGDGGQDQYIGRLACGLSPHSTDFAVLPPHFDATITDYVSENEYREIVPCLAEYPVNFKQVVPFLVASVVHHREFLRGCLPQNHLIWKNPLFRKKYVDKLKDHVILCHDFCEKTRMNATGIPSFVRILQRVDAVCERVEKLETKYDELPKAVCSELTQILKNAELQTVTHDDLNKLFKQYSDQNRADMEKLLSTKCIATNSTTVSTPHSVSSATVSSSLTKRGTLKRVSNDFQFPTQTNVKAIFDLWYEGIPAESITSFRFLEGEDLNSDSDRTYLCKAKKVLSYVVGSNGNNDVTLAAMSPGDRSKYFQEVCIPKLLELPAAKKRRLEEICYISFYPGVLEKLKEIANNNNASTSSNANNVSKKPSKKKTH